MAMGISRRGFLTTACSAAAHPLMSTMTFASAPWDARLVVIILRGGMDALGAVQPHGDPALAAYRPTLTLRGADGLIDLDGFFGMHPGLAGLMPLWNREELGFVQAVSTPYRDKRSHFDGQDLLEAGTGGDVGVAARRGGWLNRMLSEVPGVTAQTAFSIGQEDMKILRGSAPASQWAPDVDMALTPQAELLLETVYDRDPLFAPAAQEAMLLASEIDVQTLDRLPGGEKRDPLAAFAAERLKDDTRIAAYSLNGWDTHQRQVNGLRRALERLTRSILTLQDGLGPVWSKTAVIAMTEFGRTAAENGTKGTDHGTGGAMVFAGGALRGGRVYGDWPGLAEDQLYARRDLMPTADVRAYAALAMRGLFGLDQQVLESVVFPGLDMTGAQQIVA